jgi:hypothetical protein
LSWIGGVGLTRTIVSLQVVVRLARAGVHVELGVISPGIHSTVKASAMLDATGLDGAGP